jgi:hypothetical protein
MSDRIFSQEEIAILDRTERELAKVGLWSGLDNEKGKSNADAVVKYFAEWNPTIQITGASIKQCIELLTQKGLLHWKTRAHMAFESAAQGLSAQ